GDLLLEIRDLLSFAALERFRKLIRRLPALVRAAGLDLIQVIGNRLLVAGEFAEEKKNRDGDNDDAEREDDELKEDGARRFAGNVGKIAVVVLARRHVSGPCPSRRSPADIPSTASAHQERRSHLCRTPIRRGGRRRICFSRRTRSCSGSPQSRRAHRSSRCIRTDRYRRRTRSRCRAL